MRLAKQHHGGASSKAAEPLEVREGREMTVVGAREDNLERVVLGFKHLCGVIMASCNLFVVFTQEAMTVAELDWVLAFAKDLAQPWPLQAFGE